MRGAKLSVTTYPHTAMLIDSHCHLNFPELVGRLADIQADMAQHQVSQAVCICTTLEEFDAVYALAEQHPNLWATVGVHPDNEGVTEPSVEALTERAQRPRVVAIGETGLDYYRLDGRSVQDMQWQRDRFAQHIRAARTSGLPLVVHTRAAAEDTLALLRQEGGPDQSNPLQGVIHCFTESAEFAKQALDMGFYISFSGIITFKNAGDLRNVVAMVPMDRMLVETDSPYLAPVPHRGKTNNPAWVRHVAEQVAEIKQLTLEDVAAHTSSNVQSLFYRMQA
jgi:TatD DNase family protein